MEHHASGYAKVMCSAVFITGLDPEFAAENVGFFTGSLCRAGQDGQAGHRPRRQSRARHVPNGVKRTAQQSATRDA
jgi:hypothetical protein